MTGTLEIKNFRSIRALRLDCKRINVFIGEPNTGKSTRAGTRDPRWSWLRARCALERPDNTYDAALDRHNLGRHGYWLHGRVGRLERHHAVAHVEVL